MKINHALDSESRDQPMNDLDEFWPLDRVDPERSKFPCCVVWTPLPVVSWLAPFLGHVGICKEDGTILDFSGSNLVNVNDFAFGPVARYIELERHQCCFPRNLAGHTCKQRYVHAEWRTAMSWDEGLELSSRHFEGKCYNVFTCNCHSFVANCLNRVCYKGSTSWNMVSVAGLVLFGGKWVDGASVMRSFLPLVVVLCLGLFAAGLPFLVPLFCFSLLVFGWFLVGSYVFKGLLAC